MYVDSQAAIKALASIDSRSKLTIETKSMLNQLGTFNSVRVCWVPGHEGFDGNEEADKLARLGSERGSEEASHEVLPPLSYLKGDIETKTNHMWMERWNSLSGCQTSKLFMPQIDKKKTWYLLNLKRDKLRKLVGILTGHCLLGKHAKYMGLTNDDECRFCNDISSTEDVIHIICECPALLGKRFRYLKGHFLDGSELSTLELKSLRTYIDSLGNIDRVS